MKYHTGQKVWVWKGNIDDEPIEAIITEFLDKASFDENVYEYDVVDENGKRLYSSGSGESDIFETLIAAKHSRFKMTRIVAGVFEDIEKLMVHNKELILESLHQQYENRNASR